jgi:hypothetical protein
MFWSTLLTLLAIFVAIAAAAQWLAVHLAKRRPEIIASARHWSDNFLISRSCPEPTSEQLERFRSALVTAIARGAVRSKHLVLYRHCREVDAACMAAGLERYSVPAGMMTQFHYRGKQVIKVTTNFAATGDEIVWTARV